MQQNTLCNQIEIVCLCMCVNERDTQIHMEEKRTNIATRENVKNKCRVICRVPEITSHLFYKLCITKVFSLMLLCFYRRCSLVVVCAFSFHCFLPICLHSFATFCIVVAAVIMCRYPNKSPEMQARTGCCFQCVET